MPFGPSSSPEEFQRWLHQALDGLDGIEIIADKILVMQAIQALKQYFLR